LIGGFTYGGIHSSYFDLSCDTETHSLLPEQQKYVKQISGFDGVIDFGIGGYGVRVITTDIYFDGTYDELRLNTDNIVAWLSNICGQSKQLSFDDTSDRYYMAKVYSSISFVNTQDRKIGQIQFECNPPWAKLNGVYLTPANLLYNTATLDSDGLTYVQDFSTNGDMKFVVTGNKTVKPMIKIIGYIPVNTTLVYNGHSFKILQAVLWDTISIDCDAMTVTKLSDNSNFLPYLDPTKMDFFDLWTGNTIINISGVAGAFPNNLAVAVTLSPQMGV
jgi:predicted phage tail component-like protein